MTRRRQPTAEERRLWERAMAETRRLRNPAPVPEGNRAARNDPEPAQPHTAPAPAFPARLPGAAAPARAKATPPAATSEPWAQMDRRNLQRLRKGRMRIEARLDLHGMTLAQAHPALSRFVQDSHRAGRRLLLVITGKGRGPVETGFVMGLERGVLRRQVPAWLARPPLSACVLRVEPAARRHGGEGAFYVYLKRRRETV